MQADHELLHEGGRIDLELWKRLFAYTRPYRRQVVWLCVAAVGTAAVDASLPLLTRRVVDDVGERGAAVELWPYAAAYLGLTVTLCLCIWRFISLAGELRTHMSHDIRRDGFANLQRLSFSFYDHRPVGWLMARMTSDCERLGNILAWGVLDFVWGLTLMGGLVVVMFVLDAGLALLVLVVVPALILVSGYFQKRILESSRAVRRTNSRITATYNEGIMGVRTSKVFAREEADLGQFRGLSGEMYGASVRNQLLSALYLPLVLTLGSLATGLALVVGGLDVVAGGITIGTLIVFLTYTRQIFEPIHQIAHWFAEMQMAQASAERILGLIAAEPEVRDSPAVREAVRAHRKGNGASGAAPDGGRPDIGMIEFRGVSFAYAQGPPVLDDLNLRVERGQTVALVGPTGGGKSTIVSLLCRFYEPTAGRVFLDGVDYRGRSLHWLQSNLGIVLQTPHLFSGTVADNIRYGRLEASDEDVVAAAELVGAHGFIRGLEDGYATEVGEGGGRLSTGQKQLLSFARAILAEPQILVMDEATSSVDTETEVHIQRGLARVLTGRTSFVIAHRLSTVRSADRILVIEAGGIAEEGTHRELLAQRGRYHALYTQQRLRESGLAGEEWGGGDPSALRA